MKRPNSYNLIGYCIGVLIAVPIIAVGRAARHLDVEWVRR